MDNLIGNESSPRALNFDLPQYVLLDGLALDPCSLRHVHRTLYYTNLKCAYNQIWTRNGLRTSN